ncbi:MAG TPA: arylesterase [Pyrinomonadaceae bacterium]|jgi:acyl-CoA thioesterase-1|nr:arylesterase [Pyrinomonadaceae bacterium]
MKKLAFLITLAALSGLSACGVSPSPKSAARDNPPAGAPVPTPEKTLPKIVAFGDSLTAGYGLDPAQSYPALLQKKLDDDGFQYEVVNAGVSGDTSAAGVRRIDWSLQDGDVRFVILELGANDFLRLQPVAETKKNLSQIIERSKARGARVLLAGIYTTTNAGAEYQRQIHDAFQSLAQEHQVPLIPFFLEGVAGKAELNQDDGVHPNAEGTKIVADTVYSHLKPLLEEEKNR